MKLALAAALSHHPKLLILDEATAFADPENEALVQRAFEKLSKGKTVIMIARLQNSESSTKSSAAAMPRP